MEAKKLIFSQECCVKMIIQTYFVRCWWISGFYLDDKLNKSYESLLTDAFFINFKYPYVFSTSLVLLQLTQYWLSPYLNAHTMTVYLTFDVYDKNFVLKWLNGWPVWDIFFPLSRMYMKRDIDSFIRLYVCCSHPSAEQCINCSSRLHVINFLENLYKVKAIYQSDILAGL